MINNIIHDAYYLIYKFNENGKQVTNMQIQKLMYFFEAYYMNVYEVDKLYDCNFNAWAFGPVAIPLYTKFRKFGKNAIKLTDEEVEIGQQIDDNKKQLLDTIYDVFNNISAIDLVNITHMDNSPWKEVWENNGNKVGYGANTYIDKEKSKKWFKNTFVKS